MKIIYTFVLIISCFYSSSLFAQTKYGDGSLRLESDVTLDWNSSQKSFTPRDSSVYEFDNKDRMVKRHKFIYDPTNKVWISDLIHIEQFDARGNQITYTDSFTNPSKISNRYKQQTNYNNQDQEIYVLESQWNVSKSVWEPTERSNTSYQGSGIEDTEIVEEYNPSKSVWFYSVRRIYTTKPSGDRFYYKDVYDTLKKTWINDYYVYDGVDANGVKDTTIYQRYNTVTKVWENSQKFTYRYDAQKRYLGNFAYNWVSNAWQPDRRNTYILMPDGQTQDYLFENWNSSKKALLNYSRQRYAYNGKGWQLSDSTELWNIANSVWEKDSRRVMSYLNSGYLDQTVASKYIQTTSTWAVSALTRYHYKSNPLSVKSISNAGSFTIYPNPAQDHVVIQSFGIEFDQCVISIYDISGKQVMGGYSIPPDSFGALEIDLNQAMLTHGTYYVEIRSDRILKRIPLMIK